jgi:hypothetical protein
MKRFILFSGALALAASLTATPAAAQNNPPPSATAVPKAKSEDAYKLVTPATTKKVVFGELQEFAHPSGLFTIQVPEDWSAQDSGTDDEAMTFFLDASKNAVIIARAVVADDNPDDDAIGLSLQSFVENQFGALRKYQASDPTRMKNGEMGMDFSFDVSSAGKTYAMLGDAYSFLNETVLSTLVFISPKDQYEDIRDPAYDILNSYKVYPEAATSSAPAGDDLIGELTLFEGPKGAFEILAPAGWEERDQSKAGQSVVGWVSPNADAELVVEVYKDSKSYKPADLEKLIEAYVEDSYGTQPKMAMGETKSASNSAQTTATFDLEVGDKTIPMVAVLYVDKVPGAIAYMRIAVPVASLDAISSKMDEIGNSYKITRNPKL